MTKTINECIYGLKKGIIDAGLSSATSDSYFRTIIALVRKSKYSLDDDCTEFVIEDLLKISDDQHQHKKTSSNYYSTQKLTLMYLERYLNGGGECVSDAIHSKIYNPNPEHLQIIDDIFKETPYLCPSAKTVMSIHLRKFYCYVEERNVKDCEINDQIICEFLEECFKSAKASMDRIVRAMGIFGDYFRTHKIGNIKFHYERMMTGPKDTRLIPAYLPNEIEKVINVIDISTPKGLRDKAIITLAFGTGLRSIDICNLKLRDIDYKTQTLSIIQSKTKEPLVIPVPPSVLNDIATYILYGRPETDSEYIFLSLKNQGMKLKSRLGKILDVYCDKAVVKKIPRRSFHSLRRAYFTESVKAGVPIDLASEMIGHQSLKEDKAYYSFEPHINSFISGDFSEIPVSGHIYSSVMTRSS